MKAPRSSSILSLNLLRGWWPPRRFSITAGITLMVAAELVLAQPTGTSAPPATINADKAVSEPETSNDLYVVDCLLPGQLRRLGNRTYMTPRRPVRTTASDCAIRGGEYTAWDRADYKTALKVWLPAAEAGDLEAMNHVGEIFEQGLGTEPNYEIALLWYERAAKAGFKAAQVNLATLYETGRGVARDPVTAINWYRKAWGVPEGEQLLSAAEVSERVEETEARLANVSAEKETLALLAESAQSELAQEQAARAALTAQVDTLSEERDSLLVKLESQPAPVTVATVIEPTIVQIGTPRALTANGRNFGRYFALVIGNGDHQYLGTLTTPPADASKVAEVLAQQYGFAVTRIDNANDRAILATLNELHEVLEPDDNLLIYYAGYGNARRDGDFEIGYWLPTNAERPPVDTFWLPVTQIGAHLARMPARRVLVMADSSFAGLLADTPAFFLAVNPDLFSSDRYINLRFENRSRLLVTSGRDFPLSDDEHRLSLFADGVVDVLSDNEAVLPAPALFLKLRKSLAAGDDPLAPQFKAIKGAGDAVGDFYFVPAS